MYEVQIFFYRWWLATRIKAVNLEQLGRPVIESSGVECPAARMGEPLSLRKVKLRLLLFFNVEIDAQPIE